MSTAIATAADDHSPTWVTVHSAWESTLPPGGLAPTAVGICEAAMKTAAAGTNPINIGRDSRYATTPARVSPMPTRTAPTISASSNPSSTQRSLPGSATVLSAPKVSTAVRATGPVWR